MTERQKILLYITPAKGGELKPSHWRFSKLAKYGEHFERILLALDPSLDDPLETDAFLSFDTVKEGSIGLLCDSSFRAAEENAKLVVAFANDETDALPPEATDELRALKKTSCKDGVNLQIGLIDEKNEIISSWFINETTEIRQSKLTSKTRTLEVGNIIEIHAANGTAKMKAHGLQIALSGLTSEMIDDITHGWRQHEGGANKARFRVEGLAEWDKVSKRIKKMRVERIRQVTPPSHDQLRRLMQAIGPLDMSHFEDKGLE